MRPPAASSSTSTRVCARRRRGRGAGAGARAVLVGRAPMYGLVAGGEAGVGAVLETFRAELENALHLCGVASVADVPRDLVV